MIRADAKRKAEGQLEAKLLKDLNSVDSALTRAVDKYSLLIVATDIVQVSNDNSK